MNSLEIIKQELINQRNLLENKGFPVTVHNQNPSPTEITDAINSINLNFTTTTATEEDVRAGKTFFSQNNEIKTGTFDLSLLDELNSKINTLVTGDGSLEIIIPENATYIRAYAYCSTVRNEDTQMTFYKDNLVIPPEITTIGEYAFANTNITGFLEIPITCTNLGSRAFSGTNITELVVRNGLVNGSYIFSYCKQLLKATVHDTVTAFPNYTFNSCYSLKEITLPATPYTIYADTFKHCSSMQIMRFTGSTPFTVNSKAFLYPKTAVILVPYLSYSAYDNATNYHQYGNPMCGYGDFEAGATLPAELEGYTIVWYSTLDDFNNTTNAVTSCENAGTYYGAFTEIVVEETTE